MHSEFIQRAAAIQSGSQIVQSDQKKLDEIKRIRKALAAGKPVLADQERADIVNYAEILGVEREMLEERLLIQVRS
jgi:hypothetical protein